MFSQTGEGEPLSFNEYMKAINSCLPVHASSLRSPSFDGLAPGKIGFQDFLKGEGQPMHFPLIMT